MNSRSALAGSTQSLEVQTVSPPGAAGVMVVKVAPPSSERWNPLNARSAVVVCDHDPTVT